MSVLLNGLAVTMGASIGAQVAMRWGIQRRPRPMPHQLAACLDHNLRLRYRNVGDTLAPFGLLGGMTVVDLGCGTGTFTVEMARMVGSSGQVHAVDLQAPMLAQTRARLMDAGVEDQVQLHHCGAHDLPMADSSIDLVVMVAVLGEFPHRERALAEIGRILRPGGRIALSEELPDPAYVPEVLSRRWLTAAGFRFGGLLSAALCYSTIWFWDGPAAVPLPD